MQIQMEAEDAREQNFGWAAEWTDKKSHTYRRVEFSYAPIIFHITWKLALHQHLTDFIQTVLLHYTFLVKLKNWFQTVHV
jgi:hypothetical protein